MNRYPTTFLSMLPMKIVRKKTFPPITVTQLGLDAVFLKSHLTPRGLTCPLKFYLILVKIKRDRSKQADNTHSLFFFNLCQRALGMYLVGYDNIRPFTHPHIPGCGQWMLQMLFFLGTPWTCQHFYDSCSFWFVWVFFLLLFISTTQKLYKQNHQTQNQNRTTAQHCLPKLGAAKQRLHHS